jgi:cation diffusion facilitator CzcD-associated flavoprotein CzcO
MDLNHDATAELARLARADLALLSYPSERWVAPLRTADGSPVHAVVIVGGGQSGLAISAALRRDGVDDVVVLDRAPAGGEGVWERFARMQELRTPKVINGIDFGCASLSVQRWYQAAFGSAAWEGIQNIPRLHWAAYLRWYRATLDLPVENETEVCDISPSGGVLGLRTVGPDGPRVRLARTVVLATGYDGAGRWAVPDFIRDALPAERYDHTNGPVDFARLRGKRVAVLGHGASAFDNANAALAAGAARVDLCFRRDRLPRVNPHRFLETAGTLTHFSKLPDAVRWRVLRYFRTNDQPPPVPTFERAMAHPRFGLHPARGWRGARLQGDEIVLDTAKGELHADHLLLATGASIDLECRPEFAHIAGAVVRWRDRYVPPPELADNALAALPYLGAHYDCLPNDPAHAWVGRVFCYNFASRLSHGPHSTSISGHRNCVPRLVRGITAQLFAEQAADLADRLEAFQPLDLPVADDFEARISAERDSLAAD